MNSVCYVHIGNVFVLTLHFRVALQVPNNTCESRHEYGAMHFINMMVCYNVLLQEIPEDDFSFNRVCL